MGAALPFIVAGATIASTVSSIAGASQQAKSQQEMANYQAQVAANNQIIAQNNAKQAEAAGLQQAADKEAQTRNAVGAIKAAQGASGINVDSGSAVDVRSSAAELGQLDALTIRANATRQAYSYQTQAAGDQASIEQDHAAGENAGVAGNINEFGSLMSGISSAGNMYKSWSSSAGSGSSLGNSDATMQPAESPF